MFCVKMVICVFVDMSKKFPYNLSLYGNFILPYGIMYFVYQTGKLFQFSLIERVEKPAVYIADALQHLAGELMTVFGKDNQFLAAVGRQINGAKISFFLHAGDDALHGCLTYVKGFFQLFK